MELCCGRIRNGRLSWLKRSAPVTRSEIDDSNTSRATAQSMLTNSAMRLGKLEFDGLFLLLLGIWIRSGSEHIALPDSGAGSSG